MAARHSSRRIPRSRSIRPARQAAPRSACRRSSARQLTGTVTLGTLMVNGVAVSLNSGTALSGTGSLLISNGTLTLGADLSVPSNVSLGLTSTTVNGGGQLTNSGVISADNATIGTALTNNSVITVVPNNNGSAFNGAFANNAGGTLVLETNSVGGSPAGKLTIANGFTNAGSILLTDIGCCGGNTNTLTVASGILVNTGLITLTEGNSCGCGTRTLAAQLDNRGTLAALGSNTLTLSQPGANQTSSGTIELSLGSLAISSAASFTNSGTITVGASHTLTLGGVQLNNASGGTLSGGGTVAGDVSNAGTVDPGGPGTAGTLTITGTYTQTSTGVLNADIGGTTAGTQFDQLNASGSAVLGGTLNVALINGFTPASGQIFPVLTFASETGTFSAVNQPPPSNGVSFDVSYGATTFSLNATTQPGARILCVQPGSPTTGAPCTNATAYGTIQDALNAAVSGDEVRLANATYQVSSGAAVANVAASVALRGGYSGGANGWTTQGAAANTIIDGQGARFGISVSGGAKPTIQRVTVNNGGIQNVGSVTVDIGTLILQNGGTTSGTFDIANGATISLAAGTQLFTSTTNVSGGGTLLVNGGTLTVQGATIASTLDNRGTVDFVGSSSFINGPMMAEAGSVLRVQGDSSLDCCSLFVTIADGFTNHGLIELIDVNGTPETTLTISNGVLTNASDGSINFASGASRIFSGALNNQGTVSVGDHGLTWNNRGASSNEGTLNVNSGTLVLNGGSGTSFTNTGTLTMAAGQTLQVNGETYVQNSGGTLSGGGTLTLVSSTLTLNSGLSTSGVAVLNLDGSTVNGPAALSNVAGVSVMVDNSVVNAPLDNFGRLVTTHHSDTLSGPLTTELGSVLRVQGDSSLDCCSLFVTIADGFTNHGLIELIDVNGTPETTLTISNGVLTNASDGTISVDAGGARTLVASVDNEGTLNIAPGAANTLAINGALKQGSTGVLNINIGGTSAGSQYDQLNVSGAVTLDGTLNINLINGFTPASGQVFQVLTYASESGQFATINQPRASGTTFNPSYGATAFTLTA